MNQATSIIAFWQEGLDIKQMQQKVAKKLATSLCGTDAEIDTEKLRELQSNNQNSRRSPKLHI